MSTLKLLITIFLGLNFVVINGAFAEVGFESGNTFTVQPVGGSVTLYCRDYSGGNGGFNVRHYNCNNNYISPAVRSRFVNDSGVVAKKVRLTAIRANGKTKTKTKKWNSKKGQTKGRFNLWLISLTQRPLLTYSTESVKYEMVAKSGNVVEEGHFDINIEMKPKIYCANRAYHVYGSNSCSFPRQYCRRMYLDNINCH